MKTHQTKQMDIVQCCIKLLHHVLNRWPPSNSNVIRIIFLFSFEGWLTHWSVCGKKAININRFMSAESEAAEKSMDSMQFSGVLTAIKNSCFVWFHLHHNHSLYSRFNFPFYWSNKERSAGEFSRISSISCCWV